MTIAVLAANGRAGRAFVNAALAAGHTIRAGVHGASTLAPHERLEVISCDALDPAQVAILITGSDAVASFIGHVKGSPKRVQHDAMIVLVDAMRTVGVTRVISLTGTGVRFAGDIIGPVDRLLNFGVGLLDPDRVQDGIAHAEILKSSALDWTIIRVLKLQNFKSRPFVLNAHGPTRWFVNRGEVTLAVLRVIDDHSFIGEAPILSKV